MLTDNFVKTAVTKLMYTNHLVKVGTVLIITWKALLEVYDKKNHNDNKMFYGTTSIEVDLFPNK